MIFGYFKQGFPWLPLPLRMADGGTRTAEFVLDSGFEGDLIIPSELTTGLESEYLGEHPFTLADDTYRTCPVYRVCLEWEGDYRMVEAAIMDGRPLVGLHVLLGNLVQIELVDGGEVSVSQL